MFNKIDFEKYPNPKDEKEFILLEEEVGRDIFGEFYNKIKAPLEFTYKKNGSYGSEYANIATKTIVKYEYNMSLIIKQGKRCSETIAHELLHGYIDIISDFKDKKNSSHEGKWREIAETIGLYDLDRYNYGKKNSFLYEKGYYYMINPENGRSYFRSKSKFKLNKFGQYMQLANYRKYLGEEVKYLICRSNERINRIVYFKINKGSMLYNIEELMSKYNVELYKDKVFTPEDYFKDYFYKTIENR